VPARCRETRSCGRGCKGHRDYEWALVVTSSPRHWLLIRRKISDPADLAFFYCYAPGEVSLPILIKVAGKRWPVEECFQQGKGQAGLDQHQLRLWQSFPRHTVLSMCALALLAVATARPPGTPAPRAAASPGAATAPQAGTSTDATDQPEHWRDTGQLPASPRRETTPRHRPDPRDGARSTQAARGDRARELPLHLEHLATTPPGTRPMASLPGPTPGSATMTHMINWEDHKPGL